VGELLVGTLSNREGEEEYFLGNSSLGGLGEENKCFPTKKGMNS